MRNTIRVGNLGFDIDAPKLKEFFGKFGTVVSARIAESPFSGRSRGFGFVEMKSEQEAAACISNLNGQEHEGRKLLVTEAPAEKSTRRSKRKSV